MEYSGHKGGDRDWTELLRGHGDCHLWNEDGSAVSEFSRLVSGVQPQVEVRLKSSRVHLTLIFTGDSDRNDKSSGISIASHQTTPTYATPVHVSSQSQTRVKLYRVFFPR